MDENIKDILLVLTGGLLSLLGTAITNWFQFRRDREIAKRESKIKQSQNLVEYLQKLSRLSAIITDFLLKRSAGLPYSTEYFLKMVNETLEQVSLSPLYGLPPSLMYNRKEIIELLIKVRDHQQNMTIFINLVNANRQAGFEEDFINTQITNGEELNISISKIFDQLNKTLY